jgi:hypothetical protein
MSIRVGEVAVIATPKRLGSPLQDMCAGGFGRCHYRIDLGLACDILRNTDAAIAVPNRAGLRILALCLAAPQRTTPPDLKKLTLASLARFDFLKPIVDRTLWLWRRRRHQA